MPLDAAVVAIAVAFGLGAVIAVAIDARQTLSKAIERSKKSISR